MNNPLKKLLSLRISRKKNLTVLQKQQNLKSIAYTYLQISLQVSTNL